MGDVVKTTSLFHLLLVYALRLALSVSSNLDLYLHTVPGNGGGDVGAPYGAADGAAVT